MAGLTVTGFANAATVTGAPALLSATPKTVTLDPATGAVVAVVEGMAASPQISNHAICNTGDGCYFSGRIPFANQGFFGTRGTFRGSWPFRDAFGTGRFTASACWTQACSSTFGPNTTATFGGALVTGTSFTIH
jgi:hypothetical protein